MNRYPDYETYRELYARYYNGRELDCFLGLLGPLNGAKLLDLCGGEGRLTVQALQRGAQKVTLIDAQPTMVPSSLFRNDKVHVLINDVSTALSWLFGQPNRFDRAVCQQGVNYWLDEAAAERLAQVMAPQGIFVFNTFNQKPPKKPRVLEYDLDHHAFVEVSWLVGDKVYHLQARDGMEPHYTQFWWLSPERIHQLLEPHFDVLEERDGKTSFYRCMRK